MDDRNLLNVVFSEDQIIFCTWGYIWKSFQKFLKTPGTDHGGVCFDPPKHAKNEASMYLQSAGGACI